MMSDIREWVCEHETPEWWRRNPNEGTWEVFTHYTYCIHCGIVITKREVEA